MRSVELLIQLDRKSLKKLELFIQSPYFNNDETLLLAYHFIANNIVSGTVPSKFEIWSSIYPQVIFNDLKFRKLSHQLTSLIEDFFAIEHLRYSKELKLRSISTYCERHNISQLSNKIQKELEGIATFTSSESIFDAYTSRRYLKDIEQMFERKRGNSNFGSFLMDLNELLSQLFLLEKLRLILLQDNYLEEKRIGAKLFAIKSDQIEQLVKVTNLENNPLLLGYYGIYQLKYGQFKEEDLVALLSSLKSIAQKNKSDGLEIYSHLYNELNDQINQGKNLYEQWFELSKIGLETELLLIKGKIDPTDYRNISFVACRLKEYDWALRFVEDYKGRISTEYRQSAYSFSKARIHNNMGDHEEVIRILRNVEYEDITYNLNSRLMLIMAFYELDEYDTLDSTIKAFKVFLRRQRNISVKRKKNFRDFCDVVYNLIRAAYKKDTNRIVKSRDILETNPGIPSSWWLKEKLAEVSNTLGYTIEETHIS